MKGKDDRKSMVTCPYCGNRFIVVDLLLSLAEWVRWVFRWHISRDEAIAAVRQYKRRITWYYRKTGRLPDARQERKALSRLYRRIR